jgi:signal transduction histidine kinase
MMLGALGSRVTLKTGRLTRAAWLSFTLLALSLALPGISPFHALLQTPCAGAACLTGQLAPAEVQAAREFGFTLHEYADLAIVVHLFTYLLLFLTAVALIWRKPAHWAAVGGAFALSGLATATLAEASAHAAPALALPAQLIQLVLLAALFPFFALVPDGRFRPSWLRWVALGLAPAAALVAFDALPLAADHTISLVVGVLIGTTLLYRYRLAAAGPQQEQVAWVLAALALLAAAQWMGRPVQLLPLPGVPLDSVPNAMFGFFSVLSALLIAGALTCLAVAFLSDELFRVEVALNRALVYSLLTLFVVGAYVLVVGYLSLLFQSTGSLWLSLVATGLVAVLFHPVRERLQRFVNSMLYGERAEPYEVIAGLGRRLEDVIAPEDMLPAIAQTVRESLQLPYAAIAVERDGTREVVASSGSPWREPVSFPLNYQGALAGHFLVNPPRGETELDARARSLLADLAQQAGVAVHSVRLTAELRQMAADLQQSRERLILAREEERRRLRRDLHDDLAPTLIGLSLRASTIGDLIATNPGKARELSDHLDSAIRDAVGNIRRLVYDLRPPALDDLGLLAAIRERALEYSSGSGGNGLHVEVEAPDVLPPLPAAVEVAAYRIVQEGLLNVIKHAQAQNCSIRLSLDEALHITIADDGVGLPETSRSGVGLRSIRERAAELGGDFELSHEPGRGACIEVRLPIAAGDSR